MSVNFPELIKALREKNGWTQKDLASRCGVSHRTVQNWEQGRTLLSGPALVIVKNLMEDTKMQGLTLKDAGKVLKTSSEKKILDRTNSVICKKCFKSVFFLGNNTPESFDCPHCKK